MNLYIWNLPTQKSTGPNGFTTKLYQIRKKLQPIFKKDTTYFLRPIYQTLEFLITEKDKSVTVTKRYPKILYNILQWLLSINFCIKSEYCYTCLQTQRIYHIIFLKLYPSRNKVNFMKSFLQTIFNIRYRFNLPVAVLSRNSSSFVKVAEVSCARCTSLGGLKNSTILFTVLCQNKHH